MVPAYGGYEVTTDTPAAIVCPNCHSTEGVALTPTNRLCFDCRHEWNPADAPPLALVPEPPAAPTVDDVLGPPDGVVAERDAQARLDALIGTEVILEGGQRAAIFSFDDDDTVTVLVTYDDGHVDPMQVNFNDIVRSIEPARPVVELPDADALALASTVGTVAALTLRAGIAMIEGEHPNRTIGLPPTGWLPDEKGTIAITEQGVAYAVAILVHAFNIPLDTAAAFADDLMAEVTNEPTKGE